MLYEFEPSDMALRTIKTVKGYNKSRLKIFYAKNLNIEVILRILQVLREHSPVKITNLAMYSRMNHIKCKKYLQSMCHLGWIEFLAHHDNNLIKITELGIKTQTMIDSLGQT